MCVKYQSKLRFLSRHLSDQQWVKTSPLGYILRSYRLS